MLYAILIMKCYIRCIQMMVCCYLKDKNFRLNQKIDKDKHIFFMKAVLEPATLFVQNTIENTLEECRSGTKSFERLKETNKN